MDSVTRLYVRGITTRGDVGRNTRMTVEVKGCSRLYQIPDLYDTEINRETKQLIADELCVVYYVRPGNAPKIARWPRTAILPEFIVPKYGYRISGRFKNERTIKKFVVDLDDSAEPIETA